MTRQDPPRQFGDREKGKNDVATGTEHRTPTRATDASATPSEVTPEDDSEKSDGLAELKRMEENAEDGRE